MKNYESKVEDLTSEEHKKAFKKCKKCNTVKSTSEFYKKKENSDNLTGICKACVRERNKKHQNVCIECGKEFLSNKKDRIFCSYGCMGKNRSKTKTGENHPSFNSVKCECMTCKKTIYVQKYRYNTQEKVFCNQKCYSVWLKNNLYGEAHPSYNPNLSNEERDRERHIYGYRNFRNEVFERDNYTCQCCGKRGCLLNAHHIYGYAEYKELRTDSDNGICLCEECHKSYHRQYGYKNNTWDDFKIFLLHKWEHTNNNEFAYTIQNIDLRLQCKKIKGA